jgi:hypothetical protein
MEIRPCDRLRVVPSAVEGRGEASASVRAGGARLRQGYGGSAVVRKRWCERWLESPGASEEKPGWKGRRAVQIIAPAR